MSPNHRFSTPVVAVFAVSLWATTFAAIKLGLPYTTPLQFAGVRFVTAGLMLLPIIGNLRLFFQAFRTHYRYLLVVGFFQTFVLYGFSYWGISLLTGALTAIVMGAQPLFVALITHFIAHNDRMSRAKFWSLMLGVSGIVLIALKKGFGNGLNVLQLVGILSLLASHVAVALGDMYVNRKKTAVSPLMLNAWQMILGGVGLFLLSLLFEPFKGFVFPWPYYVSIFWLSSVSALSFTLWFVLLQRDGVKVSELNFWKFILPVLGALLSWWLVPNEDADWVQVAGMCIIVASIVWFTQIQRGTR